MDFSDELITRYAQEAERMLASDTKCIQSRVSLALIKGQSVYSLPRDTVGVTRVTFKGYGLLPYSGRELRQSGTSLNAPSSGQPTHYIYSDLGYKEIKIYPSPAVDLPEVFNDLWSEDAIRSGFIIQLSVQPDFTDGSVKRIPIQVRRQYIKDYILTRCFRREGKSMDIKASEYFAQKFASSQLQFREVIALLHASVEKVKSSSDVSDLNRAPGRPVLPPQFGEIVE